MLSKYNGLMRASSLELEPSRTYLYLIVPYVTRIIPGITPRPGDSLIPISPFINKTPWRSYIRLAHHQPQPNYHCATWNMTYTIRPLVNPTRE